MILKKSLLALLAMWSMCVVHARPGTEKDMILAQNKIRQDIEALCAPEMNGRFTGSEGARKAADYIEGRFRNIGILPYKSKYQWDFTAHVGTRVGSNAYFSIFNTRLNLNSDLIFMPYSGGNVIFGSIYPKVYEDDQVWLVPMSEARVMETNDFQKRLYDYSQNCISRHAAAVVFYNDIGSQYDFSPLNLNQYETLGKPVAIMNYKAYQTHLKSNLKKDWIEIDAKLGYENANTIGSNVLAYIDNKAALTVVIGAQYDHLGEGYTGADNNASGVAALLAAAEFVRTSRLSHVNFLFAAFAGGEQDHAGAKAFLKQNEHMLTAYSCMLDLDMLGRYNTATKNILVQGAATSPYWIPALQKLNKGFVMQIDSSGCGYSDFSVFYEKNIPALRISSGYHADFMKNTDIPQKINYTGTWQLVQYINSLIADLDVSSKPGFTKTMDYIPKIEALKSSLGIIPDNSFEQNGIKVGACLPNKIAEKAGILSGDVISRIGEFVIVDMNDYIEALTKTDKGKETTIIVKRDKYEFKFFVIL